MSTGTTDVRALIVALGITTGLQAVIAMATFAPAVLAPAAQADIGVPASAIGIFSAILYFSAALAAPAGGRHVVRSGPVRVSQIALLWSAAGIVLFASGNLIAVILAAMFIGLGYGPVTPASSALLARRMHERSRNIVMSIRQSGVTLGGVLAGFIVPQLIVHFGWRGAALVVALACVLCALALQATRERYDGGRMGTAAAAGTPYRTLLKTVMRKPGMRSCAAASFLYAGVQMSFGSYLVVFLIQRAQLGLIEAGALYSIAMTAGVMGRMGWGALGDYLRNARAVLCGLGVTMAVCGFAMSQVSTAWPYQGLVVLCALSGASTFGWNGLYIAEIARIVPPDEVAPATGVAVTFNFMGIVVMPFVYWLILSATGSYGSAFGFVGAAALAGAVLFWYTPPEYRAER